MEAMRQLYTRLPSKLVQVLKALEQEQISNLEEIRIYSGGQTELIIAGKSVRIHANIQMDELMLSLSAHALYSCERQLADGYIPLPGGHRAGVCGRMILQQDGLRRMTDTSSVCIRICRRIPGASRQIQPYLLNEAGQAQRVLLLGPPGCGKTTVLRDASLWLAGRGLHVAVADEREELFAGGRKDLPPGVDVLSGLGKAQAFSMLLRAMSPQVLISDEIGHDDDVQAVLEAVRCGTGLLLSAHARSIREAARRPAIRLLMQEEAFDCYVMLGRYGSVCGIYDGWSNMETGGGEEMRFGQLGCGRDGHDCHQRSRISAL